MPLQYGWLTRGFVRVFRSQTKVSVLTELFSIRRYSKAA